MISHSYRSTACLHAAEPGREGLHKECQTDATRWDGTHKIAGTCKWCQAPCGCPCHTGPADPLSSSEPAPQPHTEARPPATGGIVEPGTWLIGEPRDVPSLKLTWGEAAAVARDGLLDMEARRTALAAREAVETVVAGPRKVFTTSSLTAGPAESDGTTGRTGALEAAIKAARNAACDHPEWTPCIECRVRAAAPLIPVSAEQRALIEREALERAARDLRSAVEVDDPRPHPVNTGYKAGVLAAVMFLKDAAASLVVTGEGEHG